MIIKNLPSPQEEILPRQNPHYRGIRHIKLPCESLRELRYIHSVEQSRNINIRIIYRLPFGRCRTIGTFIINPHHDCCPTITSSQWQANHYLITIYEADERLHQAIHNALL